jgi:dienelactone hydrolase
VVSLTSAAATVESAASTTEPVVERESRAPKVAPPVLPAPTGRRAVSTRTLHLVDRDRQDPWVERALARHLMVTMVYPSNRASERPARYLTVRESRAFVAFQEQQGAPVPDDLPRGILARTEVGASRGAPVLRTRGGRPLVVLSPGFGLPRSSLLVLATQLASRGYVVALTDHAHESSGMQLPDGRLLRCAACDVDYYGSIATGRARDISFMLDRLLARSSRWSRVVDGERVAVVGHSIGGNAALSSMRVDDRVDAAVDLDGTLFDPVRRPLRGPVMLMGTDELHRPDGDDISWPHTWERLDGPRKWLSVVGSTHGSFTDGPLLVEQLVPGVPSPGLDPVRGLRMTRAYVQAFLDRHLRGRDAPLLDAPSPRFPEVSHHAPS